MLGNSDNPSRRIVRVSWVSSTLASKSPVEASASVVQSGLQSTGSMEMDSCTTLCSSSFARRIWQTTLSKCFSVCLPDEDQEPIAVVLLKGELLEATKAVQELKNSLAEHEASFKICKQEIAEAQMKMVDAIHQSRALQDKIVEQSQTLAKLKEVYGNAEKQFEANVEICKQGMIEAELKMMETLNQKQELQNTVGEHEQVIAKLNESNQDLKNRYCEIVENPCACFFAKHIEEYLYAQYEADGKDLPPIDENITASQLKAQIITDTEGFLSDDNLQIQLSDYEYSDMSVDSDVSSESTSSHDTSDLDVRYINSDLSKTQSMLNASAEKEGTSPTKESTSAANKEGKEEDDDFKWPPDYL